MRWFLPIRRWLRVAPVTDRLMTFGATLGVVALLGWGLVPAPRDPAQERLGADAPGRASGSGAGAGAALPGGEPAGGPDAGAGGSNPGGPRRSGPVGPNGPGGDGGAGGGSGGSPGRLTASDRGVTPEVIKVGFPVINFETAGSLGYENGLRTDASKAIDALVDQANKQGGVLGRRIQPVKVTVDFVLEDDQRRKCLQLTETQGVFAVVDSFAFSAEASTACVTAEQKTLLLNGNPGSSQNVRRAFPYLVSPHKDDNRKMKDLVTAAKDVGFFDPARGFRRLGILGDACSGSIYDSPTDGLKAYLRAAGITGWSFFQADCRAQGSSAAAVLQFRQDQVSHVILATRPPIVDGYLNAAKNAGFFPAYFNSDYFNLIIGVFSKRYEPQGFDGALGITQSHAGEGAIGRPLPPLAQRCSTILTDHGLPPVSAAPPDDLSDELEILELCENFQLFLQVATAAGPNLTRATWVDALAGVGDFRPATVDLARFDRPGKMTGGDTMKLVRWHRSCVCWKETTPFAPAAG